MNILAVGAHPDDIELNCAGTLARYASEGHKVHMAVFTSGNMGDLEVPPEKLAACRQREAQASADIIGACLLWPAVTDELVFPNQSQRRIMIDLMREADPDIIITHSPNDYHPDHCYVSQLVFDSFFQKGLPHIPNQSQPACRFGQAEIYHMDNVGGIDFLPSEYVDITEVFETKKKMLACHDSQVKVFSEAADTDLLGMIEVQARFRGFAAGCELAEGFCRVDAFQRGLTTRVLP
jgi:LmbE family N-acetylglucosaminyl deacetylase